MRRTRRSTVSLIVGAILLTVVAFAVVSLALFFLLGGRQKVIASLPTAAVLPSDTPTNTATATDTGTPTSSATSTYTITPTNTATETPLPSDTPTSTLTPTVTEPPTASPTVTATFTASPAPPITATEQPPIPTSEAAATDARVTTSSTARPCISIVGDSVTHGGFTYQIPATGYIVGLTQPVAYYVAQALKAHGITDLPVYDRGASNTGIDTANHPSYFNSGAYQALLRDHCQYTMIMPWYNDINPEIPTADAAPRHTRALIALVQQLVAGNPDGRIVVLNYFYGAVAPFAAQTWASGVTHENVDIYNSEISLSCNYGTLSSIPQVACANTADAFVGMGDSYVIQSISHQELNAEMIADPGALFDTWIDNYFSVDPNGLLTGDGVHLSKEGKAALGEFLITLR